MKLSAIIVTFNASLWIDKCIGSLLNSTIPVEIIVIDNCSTDGTREIIKSRYPSVRLIESNENLGFGKANNIGLKIALDEDFNYAFLLNQDAWIEPDTLEKMIMIQKRYPEYGILSPLHLSGDGINLDNNFTKYINGYSCPRFISDIVFNRELKEVYEIDFVNAALWLMSRQVLEKVGGFDPLFFMYGEDDDYIHRVKYHNFKIGICPKLLGYHDRPQLIKELENWSSERLYSSQLIKLKNLNNHLPSKKAFMIRLYKYRLRNILKKEKPIQLDVVERIIKNYSKIINHRSKCKLTQAAFLDE